MSEMVERVIRSIWFIGPALAPYGAPTKTYDQTLAEAAQGNEKAITAVDHARTLARAAIEGLRDPTLKMQEAAIGDTDQGSVWRKMIDEALK